MGLSAIEIKSIQFKLLPCFRQGRLNRAIWRRASTVELGDKIRHGIRAAVVCAALSAHPAAASTRRSAGAVFGQPASGLRAAG
jgi:hypothetical protein